MIIAFDIQKQNPPTVEEYFKTKHLMKQHKLSQAKLTEFLKNAYELSEKSSLRIFGELQKSAQLLSAVPVDVLIAFMEEFMGGRKEEAERQQVVKGVEAILKEIGVKIKLLRKLSIKDYWIKCIDQNMGEVTTREQIATLTKDMMLNNTEAAYLNTYLFDDSYTSLRNENPLSTNFFISWMEEQTNMHLHLKGAQLENEAIKVMDYIDTNLLPSLADSFGSIPMTKDGLITKDSSSLMNFLMEKYATVGLSYLILICMLIIEKSQEDAIDPLIIQRILKDFTKSNKVFFNYMFLTQILIM